MSSSLNKIAVITRCKDEPFIGEFVSYYLSQGISKIYIIDDHSLPATYASVIDNSSVEIVRGIRFKDGPEINKVFKKIKDQYDWIISVDPDEYITTRRNFNKSIREELQDTFYNVDCIKVPWVMMAFNKREFNPDSLLVENVHRWDHDKRHHSNHISKFRCRYEQIEVKCIFRPSTFKKCFNHTPVVPTIKNPIVVDSITKDIQRLDPFYNNLREDKIENAYMVCYHYRIASKQHVMQKVRNNSIKPYKHKEIVDMLIDFDYPELIDLTMRNKSQDKAN